MKLIKKKKYLFLVPFLLLLVPLLFPQGRETYSAVNVAVRSYIFKKDASGGEVVKIQSSDVSLHAVLYKPEQLEDKNPAIILVHGWAPYDVRAGAMNTYLARDLSKEGYITLSLTMRGWPESEGVDDCGWQQSTDVVNVVKWLSTQANVDPERIGLLGQSQGGQVVLNAGALDSSIKAIVAYYPVTDVELLGKDTNLEEEAIDFFVNGICAQGVTQRQRSPLYVAGDIEAPVLLMHGDKDERVPILHSELMLKALLENGKDATLFRAKNGKHRPFGGGWTNSQAVMLEFFSEKLKGNLVSE